MRINWSRVLVSFSWAAGAWMELEVVIVVVAVDVVVLVKVSARGTDDQTAVTSEGNRARAAAF